jgi:hypothetical protein
MAYVRCAPCTGSPVAGAAAGRGRRRPRAGRRGAARLWPEMGELHRRESRGRRARGGAGPRRALFLGPPCPPLFALLPSSEQERGDSDFCTRPTRRNPTGWISDIARNHRWVRQDKNGTDIFRSYLRLNPFRRVLIYPYSSPDI